MIDDAEYQKYDELYKNSPNYIERQFAWVGMYRKSLDAAEIISDGMLSPNNPTYIEKRQVFLEAAKELSEKHLPIQEGFETVVKACREAAKMFGGEEKLLKDMKRDLASEKALSLPVLEKGDVSYDALGPLDLIASQNYQTLYRKYFQAFLDLDPIRRHYMRQFADVTGQDPEVVFKESFPGLSLVPASTKS